MPLILPAPPATAPGVWKTVSLLLIPASVAIIAAGSVLDVPVSFSNPFLLSALNIAFLTIIPLYIAYISFVSFRFGGAVSTLLLGSGMLFVGLGTLATATAQLFPGTANQSITIYNITVCIGMALQLAGALAALAVWREPSAERRTLLVGTAYGVAALAGLTPVFFVPGAGSTAVRDLVLAAAIESALLASVLFFVLYRRRREDFFFWYGVGLALFGVGLLTVAFIAVFGGLLNLVGRFEQYIGACYLLGAFLVLQRRAASQNVPVRELLASFFAQAEAGYRQLVETAGDAIVVLGPRDRVLLWNAAAERMFGYTADEASGVSFPDLVLGGAPVPHGNPRPDRGELEIRRRDGSPLPVEISASSRTVDGQPVTTLIIHDLSERKRAEEALHEAEERYRFALDAARFGTFDFRVDTGEVIWDEGLKAIWGLAADEELDFAGVVGRVHPGDRDRVQRLFAAALAPSSDGTYEADYRIIRPDGSVRWTSARGRVHFRDEDGTRTAVRVVGIEHDITEQKEADEALREYAEDLRRSNEDLERFAYVSSHDLQEPLRSIVSFSQLLERRYKGRLDKDADEYLDFIVEGGNRMQTLILDLLAYSRVNSTAQELRPTDVGAVMASVERSLDSQLREAGATLSYEPLPTVTADPLQLEQVFANLVSNAVKFRRPDEPLHVYVGARRTDGFWEFSVSDNGIGIEPEYFEKIFVIFQRLHTKDAYPGTGIGLAVVKRIVERHGGQVWVESVPGEGSTFFFTLPAA